MQSFNNDNSTIKTDSLSEVIQTSPTVRPELTLQILVNFPSIILLIVYIDIIDSGNFVMRVGLLVRVSQVMVVCNSVGKQKPTRTELPRTKPTRRKTHHMKYTHKNQPKSSCIYFFKSQNTGKNIHFINTKGM